jgi:hypothetical protein
MAELHTDNARSTARTAMGYSQAFDGKGIDWQNGQPWPHRMELAQALDWITELGAMVLNLADRVDVAESAPMRMQAALEKIAKWHGEFPPSGAVYPDGSAVSYGIEFGSNGERDYMRKVACEALKA